MTRKDDAHSYIKFPSLYCRNRVNSSDHNWLCYILTSKNFNLPIYVQGLVAEKYRRFWITKLTKSHILAISMELFDMAWVNSCQSLTHNRGLARHSRKTWLTAAKAIIGQNLWHGCHRHHFSKFPDFSLTKIAFPWPKSNTKCQI